MITQRASKSNRLMAKFSASEPHASISAPHDSHQRRFLVSTQVSALCTEETQIKTWSQPRKSDPIIIGNMFFFHKWVYIMTYF